MKKKVNTLLLFSAILTTIGFLMDGDVREPGMLMRFVEFFGMMSILFTLTSSVFFTAAFLQKRILALRTSKIRK